MCNHPIFDVLLHWERGGYVIYYKRMEVGRISRKVFQTRETPIFYELRWDELFFCIILPQEATKSRNTKFIFPSAGYYERYIKK